MLHCLNTVQTQMYALVYVCMHTYTNALCNIMLDASNTEDREGEGKNKGNR